MKFILITITQILQKWDGCLNVKRSTQRCTQGHVERHLGTCITHRRVTYMYLEVDVGHIGVDSSQRNVQGCIEECIKECEGTYVGRKRHMEEHVRACSRVHTKGHVEGTWLLLVTHTKYPFRGWQYLENSSFTLHFRGFSEVKRGIWKGLKTMILQ